MQIAEATHQLQMASRRDTSTHVSQAEKPEPGEGEERARGARARAVKRGEDGAVGDEAEQRHRHAGELGVGGLLDDLAAVRDGAHGRPARVVDDGQVARPSPSPTTATAMDAARSPRGLIARAPRSARAPPTAGRARRRRGDAR